VVITLLCDMLVFLCGFGWIMMGETLWYDVLVICSVLFGLACTSFCVSMVGGGVLPLFVGSNFVYMDPWEGGRGEMGEGERGEGERGAGEGGEGEGGEVVENNDVDDVGDDVQDQRKKDD
jgi:hypothetical protein